MGYWNFKELAGFSGGIEEVNLVEKADFKVFLKFGNQPSIGCKFKFLIAIFGKAESQNIGANN
jgi:hypothetical protein